MLALARPKPGGETPHYNATMRVILESLGIEHGKASQRYQPRPYSGDVVLFRAAKQLPGLREDVQLGWKGILQGRLEIAEIPGHQQNLLIPPNVSQLADELGTRLRAAQILCESIDSEAQRELSALVDESAVPAS